MSNYSIYNNFKTFQGTIKNQYLCKSGDSMTGSLNMNCNNVNQINALNFCDGTYIGPQTISNSFDISTNEIFKINNTIILDTSNVGIGTLTPTSTLDVSGNTSMNGTLDVSGNTSIKGSLNIGTTDISSNSSALLAMNSTSQGFLPPVMTGNQAEIIQNPAEGLMIYVSISGGSTIVNSKGWWGRTDISWVKIVTTPVI